MTRREKVVRALVRRVRQEFPEALGYVAVFYDTSPNVPAPAGASAFHVKECAFGMIDQFLMNPEFARFAFAGAAVVVRQTDVPDEPDKVETKLAIRIAPGPDFEFRRAALHVIAERLPRSADELAAEDESMARELFEHLHRQASKN